MKNCHSAPNRYILFAFVVATLVGCSSGDDRYPPITEDFCSQLQRDTLPKLSDQLAPVAELMKEKTGVFPLEEGDVSMISRAWLTESAEKSIDIQYFIFSADNIGLIACDYLVRAADRGVHVRMIVDDIMVEADADELLALDAHPNLSIKSITPAPTLERTFLKSFTA